MVDRPLLCLVTTSTLDLLSTQKLAIKVVYTILYRYNYEFIHIYIPKSKLCQALFAKIFTVVNKKCLLGI